LRTLQSTNTAVNFWSGYQKDTANVTTLLKCEIFSRYLTVYILLSISFMQIVFGNSLANFVRNWAGRFTTLVGNTSEKTMIPQKRETIGQGDSGKVFLRASVCPGFFA